MYFREASLVAALAAVPALAVGSSVNVYFGQHGNADIGKACADPSFEYITLAFINVSPENGGPSGLPGSNFAGHCWAGNYENNGYVSELLNDCPYLTPGIEVCQKQYGKKVLLSIGGEFTETSNYSISSYEKGVEFARFIWGAYGPYDESWGTQPRPFDYNGAHVAVDGYDFDLESSEAGNEGYQGMIETLRILIEASGRDDIITGAPQCPLDAAYQSMLPLLQSVQFDRLWIQFYNNPQCEILNKDGTLNSGFNYDQWETFLALTPSANAKLHVGLPGSTGAAGTGYVDANIAASVLCSKQSSGSMFDGLMLWDHTFAVANIDEHGVTYNEDLYESMRCGCGECPVSTTASSIVSSTSSSTSTSSAVVSSTLESTTSSAIDLTSTSTITSTSSFIASPTPSSSPATASETSTSTSEPAVSTPSPTPSSSSASASETSTSTSEPAVSTPLPTPSSSSESASETSTLTSEPAVSSPSLTSSTSSASASETSTSTSEPAVSTPLLTSTSSSASDHSTSQSSASSASSAVLSTRPHSWSNTTWTSSAVSTISSSTVSDSVTSTESSSSIRLSTRPHSWSNTTWTSHSDYVSSTDGTLPTSSPADVTSTSGVGAGPTTASSGAAVSSSSSTVPTAVGSASSTTSVGAHQSSPISSGSTLTSSATSLAGTTPVTSPAREVTSTIWATEVHTVTSCAPTVTDCPAGTHYLTTSFPVSTTILPGSSTSAAVHHSETASSSAEQWTTSTIFSTSIYTVTSCAATITDCPGHIGSVTTEIIAVTTTVCPVTAAESTSSSPVETGTAGSGSTDSNGNGSESSSSGSTSSGNTGSESGSEETGSSSGSSPEHPKSSSATLTSGTLTTTTHVFSTLFVPVPTSSSGSGSSGSSSSSSSSSGAEGSSAPAAANNAGAPGPGYTAPSGFGHHNGTVTKTYSLARVEPTSVVASESLAPSSSTSATSPIVTAGAGRSVGGVGMAALVGVAALVF